MKSKLARILMASALCATLMLTAVACGGGQANSNSGGSGDSNQESSAPSGETYKLSWAGIGSTDAIDTWMGEEAAKRISEETNGAVEITVYPASQLGDLTQAYDEIMNGTIDIGLFTIYGTYDIITEAAYTPFLTSNLDEFMDVYGEGGFMYDTLVSTQADRGIKCFGFWPSGYLGLGFTKLEEDESNLFDFTAKKKELLRVPGMDTMMASAKAMGFETTTMPYSDVYTGLQTGVIDGSWNGGSYANYQSFRDVLKYFVDYRCCNDVYSLIMNSSTFDSMPAEYQDVVTKVFTDIIKEGTEQIRAQEEQSLKDLADYGITVISPTDAQRDEMKAYFIENVWPDFAEYYGQDFIDKMIEASK